MSKYRIIIALCLAVVAIGVFAIRVYQVNRDAPVTVTEHLEMGEWVDLTGTFFTHAAGENPEGYSLRVVSAEVISYNEFIKRYGIDKEKRVEGLDERSVVDLEIEIRNKGNEDGFIPLLPMRLVPERGNTYFIWNSDLWVENEPNSEDVMVIKIAPDTEYSTHIPFTENIFLDDYSAFESPIEDTAFELIVANAPQKKAIVISV